jgi:outer membrane autotransporter protein
MDRRKLRRLLASSSFAALLFASQQARGQSRTNPTNGDAGFLRVTAETVSTVVNFGVLDGENETGATANYGIRVYDHGTVTGNVRNEGTITLSGYPVAAGILVQGSNPSIGGQIANSGNIDIDVSGSNFLSGTGIRVAAEDFSLGGEIAIINRTGATIDISIKGVDSSTETGVAAVGAHGWGIVAVVDGADTYDGDILNSGRIDVGLTNVAHATHSGAAAKVTAIVTAEAAGMGIFGDRLFGGVWNTNEAGTAALDVALDNSVVAEAVAADNLTADASAKASIGIADAYGMRVQVFGAVPGTVQNNGTIDVDHHAKAHAKASAASDEEDAVALAKATANMLSTGIDVYVTQSLAGFQDDGSVSVSQTANIKAEASADAGEGGRGTAKAVATHVTAAARGVLVNAGTVAGGIANQGSIDVNLLVTSTAHAIARAATTDAVVGASAAANIVVEALGFSAGGTSLSGGFFNSGEIGVDSVARIGAAATATGGEDSVAAASAKNFGIDRPAGGLTVFYQTVSGDIRNEAKVEVAASADFDVKALATGDGDVHAAANMAKASTRAYAGWFYLVSVDGAFHNTGDLVANATFAGKATASAIVTEHRSGNALADGVLDVGAKATGALVIADTWTGIVENKGSIAASAAARATGKYHADNAGEGNASAGTSAARVRQSVQASATGLLVLAVNVGGGVANSGAVLASAQAAVAQDIAATAAEGGAVAYGQATADVSILGVTFGALALDDGLDGNVTNSGKVDVLAAIGLEAGAKAVAGGGPAVADLTGIVDATARALSIWMQTVTGDVTNSGDIVVVLGGSTEEMGAQASYKATATAPAGKADARAAVGTWHQLLQGADWFIDHGFGPITNTGTIALQGELDLQVLAQAKGDGATAAAALGSFAVSATGLAVEAITVAEDVVNSGNILIDIDLGAELSAKVDAGTDGATARANFATATQSGEVLSTVTVAGFDVVASAIGGRIANDGTIQADLALDLGLNALAAGVTTATASAALSGLKALVVGLRVQGLTSSGLVVQSQTIDGGVVNEGVLSVHANVAADLSADANGGFMTGIGLAKASVDVGNLAVVAVGMELAGTGIASQVIAGFSNADEARIVAQAKGSLQFHAIAAASEGSAKVDAILPVTAVGMRAREVETLNDGFHNDGSILVRADALIDAQASAPGTDDEAIFVRASAIARGMVAEGTTAVVNGGMRNGGLVMVSAFATAKAVAGAAGLPDGEAQAQAFAHATAMRLAVGSFSGDMVNSATLAVRADSSALAQGTAAQALAAASAIGMQASVFGLATGSVINSGRIRASAFSDRPALAVGQRIAAGTWSGALVNAAAGDIRVFASDSFKATAIGMAVESGAEVQGGLQNSGIVVAEAVGLNVSLERAIDVTHHSNSGLEIRMADGTLEVLLRTTADAKATTVGTAVAMQDNTIGDTLQWSGGLVLANVVGTSLDVMNVFAGADATFNFSDQIVGLGEVNVNTAAKAGTPVQLRLNGVVSQVGTLNVNENGTLRVGLDADIDVGTYDQDAGGTVIFEITPQPDTDSGLITVSNIAHLAGGIEIDPAAGFYDETQSYLLIEGQLDGAFTRTPDFDNSPLLDFTIEQENPDVRLIVTRTPFDEVPGLTHNQKAVSEVIEELYDPLTLPDEPPGGLGDVIAALFDLTSGQYYDALDDLHGAEYAQMAYAAFQAMDFLAGGVTQRLGDARSAGGGAGQSAAAEAIQYAAAAASDSDLPQTQLAAIGNDPDRPASIWGKGFGGWGSLDGDAEAPGHDRTSGAFVAGVDYRFDEEFLIGIAGSYVFSSLDFDDGDQGDIDSFQIGVFGSWDSGTWYVDGLVSYAFQSYETERHVGFLGEKAEGDYDGGAVQAYGEIGYQFALCRQALLTPLLGLGYTGVWTDSFTEKGASGANLRVDEASYDSLATTLGVRGSLALDGWEPSLFLGWRHEFLDDHGEADLAFAAVPDAKWTVIGSDVSSDAGLVGVGVVAEISAQFEAVLDYGGQFSGSGSSHSGSLGLRLKF